MARPSPQAKHRPSADSPPFVPDAAQHEATIAAQHKAGDTDQNLRPGFAAVAPDRARSLLRFITCGSVDDGKSTLIGRLLYDAGQIYDDQLTALDAASDKFGTRGKALDFALLVDGLAAEREQGITIDVAYRYFHTKRRSFIVADTPGHEQYTRNMATGASTADLAILLIDARKGVVAQTRRHGLIASMLGVRQLVLAVNKMDLVDHAQARFEAIVADFRALGLDFGRVTAIPVVATEGENLVVRGPSMPWYDGPTLLDYLETVEARSVASLAFRFPVQWINRPNSDFRGLTGWVASGRVAVGDPVRVATSGASTRIARIVTADGDMPEAVRGQSVTLTLAEEVDVSRGDVIVGASDAARPVAAFAARLLWMSAEPLAVGREYALKLATSESLATVTAIEERIDISTLAAHPADRLDMNSIGRVHITTATPMLAVDYGRDRTMGAFILIDKITNETVALGLVVQPVAPLDVDGAIAPASPDNRGERASWTRGAGYGTAYGEVRLSFLLAVLGVGAVVGLCAAWLVTRDWVTAFAIAALDLGISSALALGWYARGARHTPDRPTGPRHGDGGGI